MLINAEEDWRVVYTWHLGTSPILDVQYIQHSQMSLVQQS